MTGLKIVESFDHAFTLAPDAQATLYRLLRGEVFCQEVCAQAKSDRAEFTTLLFQPVPYTAAEPKGMPQAYEKYHDSPEHVIINVPPVFMFEAKIFKPNRLCAIYRIS